MTTYNVSIIVNGTRTVVEVKGDCSTNAIKVAQAQFPTGRVEQVTSK